MRMKFTSIIFTIIFLWVCKLSFASDTIIVHKDSRLDIFTGKQSEVNKRTSRMTSSGLYKGYRIQILTTRSREEAFKLKAELLHKFPSQQSYVVFQSPYFKVRIGNFTRNSDAVSFKSEFLSSYPRAAYVVEDVIEHVSQEDDNEPSSN